MKQINYIYKFALLVLSLATIVSSCTKEDTGVPTVTNIRYTDPALADQSLDTVGLGETIAIQGTYLSSTKSVTINDYPVTFNPNYATDANLIIKVPDETPTLATDPEVTNQMVIVTEHGTTTIPMVVLPPKPIITKISNEMANAGDQLTITGSYFFFLESVTFPGDIAVTEITTNANGTELYVTVPDGITEAGEVLVTSASGTGTCAPKYTFNDRTGIFADFDGLFAYSWGGGGVVDAATNPTPAPLDGNYYGFDYPDPINPGSWWFNELVLAVGTGSFSYSGPANEYAIKFEAFVPKEWNSGFWEFNYMWSHFYRFKPWDIGEDPTEYWVSSEEREDLVTETWTTFVIPIDLFRTKVDGNPSGVQIATVDDVVGQELVFNFANPGDPEGTALAQHSICMDNLRLVKIK